MLCVCCADIMESGHCACADWHVSADVCERLARIGETLARAGIDFEEDRVEYEQWSYYCNGCGEYISGTQVDYEKETDK